MILSLKELTSFSDILLVPNAPNNCKERTTKHFMQENPNFPVWKLLSATTQYKFDENLYLTSEYFNDAKERRWYWYLSPNILFIIYDKTYDKYLWSRETESICYFQEPLSALEILRKDKDKFYIK